MLSSVPFQHICGVISSVFLNGVFLNAITVAPRFSLQGLGYFNKSDMHSCSPRIFSNRADLAPILLWPRIEILHRNRFPGFEKASDIRNALSLSFLFRGGDVHGTGSFSTTLPLEARLGAFGFRAESKADTCVQLADCLKGLNL